MPTMTLCYGVSSGYRNPPACLPGGVCGEGAAGGVFCGVVDCVVGFSRLPFGVCFVLLRALWWTSRRGFPFASWVPGVCTPLDSVAFGAQCDSDCLVCCSMRDYWLLHLTLLLLLHGLLFIYFSL